MGNNSSSIQTIPSDAPGSTSSEETSEVSGRRFPNAANNLRPDYYREQIQVTRTTDRPKPCCVCKEEKATRDECMLFSDKGEEQCLDKIDAYKKCMAGFGFNV